MTVYREQTSRRDTLAAQLAAALIIKSDVAIDYKTTESAEVSFRCRAVLDRIATVAYLAADALIEAGRKNHSS